MVHLGTICMTDVLPVLCEFVLNVTSLLCCWQQAFQNRWKFLKGSLVQAGPHDYRLRLSTCDKALRRPSSGICIWSLRPMPGYELCP